MGSGQEQGVSFLKRLIALAPAALVWAGLVMATAGCGKSDAAAAQKPPEPALASAVPCGEKGQRDCPTQAWMKANLQPFLLANDAARLAEAFEQLASVAPAGYDDWATIAGDAGKAARAGDLSRVKQSCADCHSRYRARFRGELRPRRLL
jgi:hypothetical protein